MKTICILTYERTGSGWLCDVFDADGSVSVHEIFSDDPTLFFSNTYKIFAEIYKVDLSLLFTMYDIYHPNSFFIDPNSHEKIKQKILLKNIYNSSLLFNIKNICEKANYNLIFKIFPQNLNKHIEFNDIIKVSDLIILNYRKNVLNSYISLQITKKTGEWYSSQNRLDHQQKNNYDLVWNIKEYLQYFHYIESQLTTFKQNICNHNHILLSYEEIHENYKLNNQKDKILYVNDKLDTVQIKTPLKINTLFEKQNTLNYQTNSQSIFINYNEFNLSVNHIPIYIEL